MGWILIRESKYLKRLSVVILLIVTSCIIEETVLNEPIKKSNFEIRNKSHVVIEIKNNAEEIILEIDDCKVESYDSITVFNTNSIILNYGEYAILTEFITEYQKLDECKLWLQGSVKTNCFVIYDGKIQIPLKRELNPGMNFVILTLYGDCPWYDENMTKILQPITFSTSIDDWENNYIEIK